MITICKLKTRDRKSSYRDGGPKTMTIKQIGRARIKGKTYKNCKILNMVQVAEKFRGCDPTGRDQRQTSRWEFVKIW